MYEDPNIQIESNGIESEEPIRKQLKSMTESERRQFTGPNIGQLEKEIETKREGMMSKMEKKRIE